MLVCTACRELWRGRLLTCPRCRTATLRTFGTDPVDADHPIGARYPLHRIVSRPLAGPARPVNDDQPAAGPARRRKART